MIAHDFSGALRRAQKPSWSLMSKGHGAMSAY